MSNDATNERSVEDLPERDTYTPNDLAEFLFGREGSFQGGKRVRAYLRANYTRPSDAKGKSWTIKPDTARTVVEHFLSEQTGEADAV